MNHIFGDKRIRLTTRSILYRFGFNPLKPMVCWMGNHPVLILEFPLYEAFVAAFYFLFGEQIVIARFISILFWLGSAIYLYFLIELLYQRTMAQFTTLIYSILPLGLYYSRAVHIDCTALFLVHGFCYHTLRSIDGRAHFALSVLFGCLAAVVKAPYLLPVYLPLSFLLLGNRTRKVIYGALIAPMIVFIFWQIYVIHTNTQSPDYSFLPGYFKFVDMRSWYFGTIGNDSSLVIGNCFSVDFFMRLQHHSG
jgi:4-amino-4-deoxy-L-arabinose transferase-like glycosyltransferase